MKAVRLYVYNLCYDEDVASALTAPGLHTPRTPKKELGIRYMFVHVELHQYIARQ